MRCDNCGNEGKNYIAFPEEEHLTEDITTMSLCQTCKPQWYKLIPRDLRMKYRHWILRSCNFKTKLEELPLTQEQQDSDIPVKKYKVIGYSPDEEDISI